MRPGLSARLATAATRRTDKALVRRRVPAATDAGGRLQRAGVATINFCGNDYLGLTAHADVAGALAGAARRFGSGSGASPLVTGYHPEHRELEAALADFCGREAALLFPSGYQANLAVGQALIVQGRAVVADRLNHASLNDGCRLAGARLRRYSHADAGAARIRLGDGAEWVVTDGVFSMDGGLAPVAELARMCDDTDTPLWLDDAHGFGVLGDTGRGCLEYLNLPASAVDVYVATFGKALGTAGAFVAGDRALIDHLVNTARPLIYSTAAPPAMAAATRAALDIMQAENWRRERVFDNVRRFRTRGAEAGLELTDSFTPIQPVILGDNRTTLAASEYLADRGYAVAAIRPPTVPAGTARLRITLSAAHSPQDINGLVDTLNQWILSSTSTVTDRA